jgi:hypothetical protein
MTKEEFIEFIKELGFRQTYQSDGSGPLNSFSMNTDSTSQKYSPAYLDQLKISIDDEIGLVQLSLSQMSTHMISGKNFGKFSLKTFGDKNDLQMELFLSFILGSFNQKPKSVLKFMRDKKIENILQ